MTSASLGLIIMSIMLLYLHREQQAQAQTLMARTQGDTIGYIRTAAETLIFEHWVDYQEGRPITRNHVTLPFGASPGQAMQPTVEQLSRMNLGIDGISDVGSYKSLTEGGYKVFIYRQPAGCEASPSGVDCNLSGLVCTDRPVRDTVARNEVDALGIGEMVSRLGANAGASMLGGTGEITGNGGAWSAPNPIAGTPAGIVCARFGFGTGEYQNFLRVRDSRDPQFMNNVTLKGGLHVRTSGNYGDACTTEGMAVWGRIEGKPVWLQCVSGRLEPGNGIAYASEASACTQESDFGMTTENVALMCSRGKWVSSAAAGLRSAAYYQHNATVPAPSCRPGLTPSAVIAAVSSSVIIGGNNAGNNTGSYQASIGSSWRVTVTGSDGSPAGSHAAALVLAFCNP